MKFLKRRNNFLFEAKIKDVILPTQAKEVEEKWGREFLDLESIEPTDKIIQNEWKLDEEDKMRILSSFFGNVDLQKIKENLESLPDHFVKTLDESIDLSLYKNPKFVRIMQDFKSQPEPTRDVAQAQMKSEMPQDAKETNDIGEEPEENRITESEAPMGVGNSKGLKFSIDVISQFTEPLFRKISVGDTKKPTGADIIDKDDNGVPRRDEDGNIIKRKKQEGEVIFSKNLVNITAFVDDYNDCFPSLKVEKSIFSNRDISSIINLAAEDMSRGEYEVDFLNFTKDMFLMIKHNPTDILNMSVSTYYSSCQNLYTGMYREKVIGNVFDPNTIPAFIVFKTPIIRKSDGEILSNQLPLCRMMIRNLESFDPTEPTQLFFDRCYPDRCKDVMDNIIEEYTKRDPLTGKLISEGMKPTTKRVSQYLFTPDLPEYMISSVEAPYMDRLGANMKRYIGVNTKSITLTPNIDWSEIKISKNAKLEELIIQSSSLPKGLLDIPMTPSWIKFKYMELKDLTPFLNLKAQFYGFENCKLDGDVLGGLPETTKKLQISNRCQFTNLDLSNLPNLDEVHFLFTLRPNQVIPILSNLPKNIKKIIISTDVIISNPQNLQFTKDLRRKGMMVEYYGPKSDKLK